jgi:hypothetical protein
MTTAGKRSLGKALDKWHLCKTGVDGAINNFLSLRTINVG